MNTAPLIVAYGVGTDSTAMLIEMERRGIRPDLILSADTGSEHPRSYAYLPVINAWLASVGFPAVTIVRNPSPIAGDASLADECFRKSVLPSLAYGGHSCSIKWKIEPQNRYVRSWQPAVDAWKRGELVRKAIGYDAGPRDVRRRMKSANVTDPHYDYWYPLIEWGLIRENCIEIIRAAGLPLPGKSACWMCPASKAGEIDALRTDHPELLARAVEIETRAKARGLRTVKGLGRSFAWGDHLAQGSLL